MKKAAVKHGGPVLQGSGAAAWAPVLPLLTANPAHVGSRSFSAPLMLQVRLDGWWLVQLPPPGATTPNCSSYLLMHLRNSVVHLGLSACQAACQASCLAWWWCIKQDIDNWNLPDDFLLTAFFWADGLYSLFAIGEQENDVKIRFILQPWVWKRSHRESFCS